MTGLVSTIVAPLASCLGLNFLCPMNNESESKLQYLRRTKYAHMSDDEFKEMCEECFALFNKIMPIMN
jgi:hypothetical protein